MPTSRPTVPPPALAPRKLAGPPLTPERIRALEREALALAKRHPVATASAALGAGVLIGVAAQRALRHTPTVGEVVLDSLAKRASKVSRQLRSAASAGLKVAKTRARQAVK
jgi:hypothetical protein